ncbi:MAG TPA: hypothetical protein VFI31_18640 [Pirellulales bacterium]|nr:hypothetical protein [Pirellulales bacterium]
MPWGGTPPAQQSLQQEEHDEQHWRQLRRQAHFAHILHFSILSRQIRPGRHLWQHESHESQHPPQQPPQPSP